MEIIKWSSSVFWLQTTLIDFGLALAEICQTLASNSAKRTWHVQNQPNA
jgi:hypothetical protein